MSRDDYWIKRELLDPTLYEDKGSYMTQVDVVLEDLVAFLNRPETQGIRAVTCTAAYGEPVNIFTAAVGDPLEIVMSCLKTIESMYEQLEPSQIEILNVVAGSMLGAAASKRFANFQTLQNTVGDGVTH